MNDLKYASETKNAVEEYIKDILGQRRNQAAVIHPRYAKLWDRIYDISINGGKRLRPYLTMLGYGKFSEEVVPIAVSQELIHIAMLIHDDIIDQDLVRHGQLNINGYYKEEYMVKLDNELATHYAYSSALIAGDALIAEAHQAIITSPFEAQIIKQLSHRLHLSIFEVVGGELMDVEASFLELDDYDPIVISRYKTASYSFIGPLISGAICNNSNKSTIESLEKFGLNAGIAFQLQDDILGVYGDSKKTGKSTTNDLREARYTVLVAEHHKSMSAEMQERFSKYFGSESASDEDIEALKNDMQISGARQKTEQMVERYLDKALTAVVDLPQSADFKEFTIKMMKRYK